MQISTADVVTIDGVPVPGRRLAALLTALAERPERRASAQTLVDEVWPDFLPADPTAALHALVARLRRLGVPVETFPNGYGLGPVEIRTADVVTDGVPTGPTSATPEPSPTAGHAPSNNATAPATIRATDRRPASWRRRRPLIGREPDLAEVEAAMRTSPLVTVVAPGGAGKTTLAVEVARRAAAAGTPVRVVELAAVRDAADVATAVTSALGNDLVMTVESVTDRRRLSAEHLASLDGLLVVDNCEHLADTIADHVAALLDDAPDLTVLATSRAPLAVAGERVHRLGALGDADAMRLLHERAVSAGATVTWDDAGLRTLANHLDNLPLALELAAARLRAMPIADVLRGLDDRFGLLDDVLRGLPDRHASLWALVDWSWDLIDEHARTMLARTAVIPSSFDADAARAASGLDAAATRTALALLVDQSLLTLDADTDEPRYRMLETVREYGEIRLDARGDREAALDDVATWAATLAAGLSADFDGSTQVRAVHRAVVEQDTFVMVLRRAIDQGDEPVAYPVAAALFWMWTLRGLHEDVEPWAARLLHAHDPAARIASPAQSGAPGAQPDVDAILDAAVTALTTAAFGNNKRTAVAAHRLIRRTLRERGAEASPRGRAFAGYVIDMWPAGGGPLPQPEAVEAMAGDDDPVIHAFGLFAKAALAENLGGQSEALSVMEEAYEAFAAIGNEWGMGMAALGLGQHLTFNGATSAQDWLMRGVTHLERIDATPDLGSARVMLDIARALAGDTDAHDRLVALTDDPDADPANAALACVSLALIDLRDGRSPQANAERAIILGEASTTAQVRVGVTAAALTALLRGAPDAGIDAVRARAVALVDPAWQSFDLPVLGTVALLLAEVAWRTGDDETARELWAIGNRCGASSVIGFKANDLPAFTAMLGDEAARATRREAAVALTGTALVERIRTLAGA